MRNIYEVVIIKPDGEKKNKEVVCESRQLALSKHPWMVGAPDDFDPEEYGWIVQTQYKGTLGD